MLEALPLPSACGHCGENEKKMQVCSGCRSMHYCSRQCQRADWNTHRQWCRGMAASRDSARQRTRALRSPECGVCHKDVTEPAPHSHEFACGHRAHVACHEERGATTCAVCGEYGAPIVAEMVTCDGLSAQEIAAMVASIRKPWYQNDPMLVVMQMMGYVFQVEAASSSTDDTEAAERKFINETLARLEDPDDLCKVIRKHQQQAVALLPQLEGALSTDPAGVRLKDLPTEVAGGLVQLRRGLKLAFSAALGYDERYTPFVENFLLTMGF